MRLKTKRLLEVYEGEERPGNRESWCHPRVVEYLTATERGYYELQVKAGKLHDAEGVPFDTRDASSVHGDEPRAIFVMDADGRIYASKVHASGRFHHSSLIAGAAAAAAGELEVENGTLKLISNKSGHYRPSPSHVDQVLEVLAEKGIDTRSVEKDYM